MARPELEHAGIVQKCNKEPVVCGSVGRVVLDYKYGLELNYGIANVMVCGNAWSTAMLCMNGVVIDVIHRKAGQTSFPMLDNGNCLPLLHTNNSYLVHTTGVCDAILYDVVVVDLDQLKNGFSYKAYSTEIKNEKSNIYWHTIDSSMLTIRANQELTDLFFINNGDGECKVEEVTSCATPELPFAYVIETKGFSRKTSLTFTTSDKNPEVYITTLRTGEMKLQGLYLQSSLAPKHAA